MQRKVLLAFVISSFLIASGPLFSDINEEVQVNIIEIWAKVTDKNNQVVTDLKAEDFQIYVDGQKMEVRCFDRTFDSEDLTASTQADQEEPRKSSAMSRKFIFFFDLLHSSARDIDFLKRKVSNFLENSFREDDQGMIFVLLPSVKLGVVQKMTNNKEALVSVIDKMRGNPSLEVKLLNNEKELLDVLYPAGSISASTGPTQGPGSRAEETIRQARGLARTFASQERNLSKLTLNSFLSVADYLSDNSLTGRLVMILVSGGFSLRPGQSYFDIIDKAVENQMVVGTEDLVFQDRPENDFEYQVRDTIGLLNRLNVTIYAIDSNGLVEFNRGSDRSTTQLARGVNQVSYTRELQDSLAMITRETGGMLFSNSQNFEKGLALIAADMNQQYWLCSNLPANKKRGSYHKIDVKVKRDNLKIRHRKGYFD